MSCPFALLLCSLAVIPCICSSGDRLSAQVIVRAFYGDAEAVESRTFRTVSCPWMASSRAQVQVEDKLSSFAEFEKPFFLDLDEVINRSQSDPSRMAVESICKKLADVRDSLFALLFSRREDANMVPPTSRRVVKRCESFQCVLDRIRDDTSIPNWIRWPLERCALHFVFPKIMCWIDGGRGRLLHIDFDYFHQEDVVDFITQIEFVELATRADTTPGRLSPTFHPGLVVCRNFDFITKGLTDAFNSSLLSERLILYQELKFEALAASDEKKHFGSLNQQRMHLSFGHRIQIYHLKIIAPDGSTEWELVADIPARYVSGTANGLYLSLIHTNFELHVAISKITNSRITEYYPIGAERRELRPLKASLALEIMELVAIYLLANEFKAELYNLCRVCRRTRKISCLCFPAAVEEDMRLYRRAMIPSCRIVEFALASLITLVLVPVNDFIRQRAIKRLERFFNLQFPLLRNELAAVLEEYNNRTRPLPERLAGCSDKLLSSKILHLLSSRLLGKTDAV